MESSPITSRQIDGETTETVTDFIFLGSKITADGDCSHEIKRRMEKEMATQSSILAWKNPWTEEPGGLQSMGLHDWACVHEGGGRWVGSNKLVELKKKIKIKNKRRLLLGRKAMTNLDKHIKKQTDKNKNKK